MGSSENSENERLALEICQQRQVNGQCYEPGTFVAIAEGRVVGIGKSFEEADAILVKTGVAVGVGMICEVAEPALDVVRCEAVSCL
jgi:hypothetical protein